MLLTKLLTILFAGSVAALLTGCANLPVPNIRACKTNPLDLSKRCAFYLSGESETMSWDEWYVQEDADGLTEEDKTLSIRDTDYLGIKVFIEGACAQLGKQCDWGVIKEKLELMEKGAGYVDPHEQVQRP